MKTKKSEFPALVKITVSSLHRLLSVPNGLRYVLLQLFSSALGVLISFGYILLPGLIINELTAEIHWRSLLLKILLLALCPVANHCIGFFPGNKISKLRKELIRTFFLLYHDHVVNLNFELLESPQIRTLKQRTSVNIPAPLFLFDRLLPLLLALFELCLLSTIIFTLHPLVILLIFSVVLFNSFITKKINRANFQMQKEISTFSNIYYTHYFDMTSTESAKELRLFNLGSLFLAITKKDSEIIDKKTYEDELYGKKMRTFHIIAGFLQQTLIYGYVVLQVVRKTITVGAMTIYLASIEKFFSSLQNLFSKYMDISRYSYDLQEYCRFMELLEATRCCGNKVPKIQKDSVIEFSHVSFHYPGSTKLVLNDLSIKLRIGERLCIVGENGSGKTTFVKLLLGFYQPCSGKILLDGTDIREFDFSAYQNLFSSVFQDSYLYNFSLRENIILSAPEDEHKLRKIISRCNLDSLVNSLPHGENTQIYKNIAPGGFDPSGGEAQKIAIARALYYDRKICILDEPTAALDPNAEYEIYTKFHELIQGKTAVLITHRLSAVQLADVVAVFDNGKLSEYGTHRELYEQGGKYKEMYDKQAAFCVKSDTSAAAE